MQLRDVAEVNETPGSADAAQRRIEILFIIDYFHRTGGTEKHLAQLIAGLPPEEFRSTIVVFDLGANPLLDGLRARGVQIVSLPVGREYVPNAAIQGWRLRQLIRTRRYDIIQTMHQKADSYGALIAWLSGCRHLVSSKRDTGELRRPWHFFINRRLRFLFEKYIVVADAVGAAVVANERLPLDRIVTIYNGVDTALFHVPDVAEKARAREQLGVHDGDFVVGMVAGFRPEKNYAMFFAGLRRALSYIPRLKVIAVGGGPELPQFRAQVAATELGPRTVFSGAVENVVPYLWAMDVACLTPGSNEGFSNAILEQMSVGLPVVATAVGGNGEAIVDGQTGRVIAPSDSEALARALIDLHANPTDRLAFGIKARQQVEEKFSLQRMCSEHAALYRSICLDQPSSGRHGVVRG